MSFSKKHLPLAIGGAVVVVAGLTVIAGLLAKRQLSPGALVERMEREWVCRAAIGSSETTVFGLTGVVLNDVKIVPPGEDPLAPLQETGIACDRIELRFLKAPLFGGRLEVTAADIDGILVKSVLGNDGRHTLGNLFAMDANAAAGMDGFRSAVLIASPPAAPDPAPFLASDLPLPGTLAKASLKNGRAELLLPWGGRFVADSIALDAPEIDIDSRDLAAHNRAVVDASLRLKLDVPGEEASTRSDVLDFGLATEGEIIPFDAATGELRPDAVYNFRFLKGSSFTARPLVGGIADDLKDWKEASELLETLAGRAELQNDSTVSLGFSSAGIRLAQPAALVMPSYTFALQAESRVRPADKTHSFQGAFTLSEETTEKTVKTIESVLREKTGKTVADIARQLVVDPMVSEGRLTLAFSSEGDLGNPDVSLEGPLGDIASLIDEATEKVFGKKAKGLGGFLRGLLK